MHRGIESAAGVSEGDVLAGKYRVERVLGVGGMGVVVSAFHVHLDTKVAIKFLLPEMLGTRDAVVRFAKEARAAVKITSDHVARVFDVGVLDNGAPYMVMEFLEGEDLSEWLKKRGALPAEQAVEFILHACVAIAEAHSLGIVHRDLKPANLFCIRRSDGQLIVKVLDFGISKVTPGGSGPVSVTQTSALMGSPLYMSPEQMRSTKAVDAQTDIWSLGVILFELLTGRTPFDGETLSLVAIRVATEAAPSLRSLRSDLPPGLEDVVARCLQKEAKDRYPDVAALARALQRFAPAHAKTSVDRIAGIVQSARSSPSLTGLPAPIVAGTLVSSQPEVAHDRTSQTNDPVGGTLMQLPVNRTRAVLGAIAGVAAIAVIAVALALRAPSRPDDRAASTVAPPKDVPTPTAPTTAPPDESPKAPSTAAATPEVAPPVPSPASAPSARPTPSPPPGPRGPRGKPAAAPAPPPVAPAVAAPAPAPAPAPAARPAPACDPPYYFDANGTRVFKKECL